MTLVLELMTTQIATFNATIPVMAMVLMVLTVCLPMVVDLMARFRGLTPMPAPTIEEFEQSFMVVNTKVGVAKTMRMEAEALMARLDSKYGNTVRSHEQILANSRDARAEADELIHRVAEKYSLDTEFGHYDEDGIYCCDHCDGFGSCSCTKAELAKISTMVAEVAIIVKVEAAKMTPVKRMARMAVLVKRAKLLMRARKQMAAIDEGCTVNAHGVWRSANGRMMATPR